MTREKAKELLPIIQAYAEGKTIEWFSAVDGAKWEEITQPLFDARMQYRIKPEGNHIIEQNAGENRIEGGVVSISGSVDTFRCWKCGRTLPVSERTNIIYASNPPRYSCKECEGIKKEKQDRPFKDCNELIKHYQKKYKSAAGCDIYFPSLYKPSIWVKNRNDYTERLIVTFGEDFVKVGSKTKPISLYVLFSDYEFLDGTPCGITE